MYTDGGWWWSGLCRALRAATYCAIPAAPGAILHPRRAELRHAACMVRAPMPTTATDDRCAPRAAPRHRAHNPATQHRLTGSRTTRTRSHKRCAAASPQSSPALRLVPGALPPHSDPSLPAARPEQTPLKMGQLLAINNTSKSDALNQRISDQCVDLVFEKKTYTLKARPNRPSPPSLPPSVLYTYYHRHRPAPARPQTTARSRRTS